MTCHIHNQLSCYQYMYIYYKLHVCLLYIRPSNVSIVHLIFNLQVYTLGDCIFTWIHVYLINPLNIVIIIIIHSSAPYKYSPYVTIALYRLQLITVVPLDLISARIKHTAMTNRTDITWLLSACFHILKS